MSKTQLFKRLVQRPTQESFKESIQKIKDFVAAKKAAREEIFHEDLLQFTGGKKNFYMLKAAGVLKDITKLGEEGRGPVQKRVQKLVDETVDDFYTNKRPINDLRPELINKEILEKTGLPKIGKRNLNKYLNKNTKYKEMIPTRNSITQSVTKQKGETKENLKKITYSDAKEGNVVAKARPDLPQPRGVEEFILRDLRRYAVSNKNKGSLFQIIEDSKSYNQLKIFDAEAGETLDKGKIIKYIKQNDPRFQEYVQTFKDVRKIKSKRYGDGTLNDALKKIKRGRESASVQLGHVDGVAVNPLRNLEPQLAFANQAARAKGVDFKKLGLQAPRGEGGIPRKLTAEENITRFVKFADRSLKKEKLKKGAAGTTGAVGASTVASAEEDDFTSEQIGYNLDSDVEYGDPDTWNLKVGDFLETGAVATAIAPLATKKGRSIYGKAAGTIARGVGTPFGIGLLTYGLSPEEGYDLSKRGDRLGFEVEALFAKPLVRESQRLARKIPASNPLLRRATQGILNLGLPARLATTAARVATPLGLLSLAGEAGLFTYQEAMKTKEAIDAMSEEEKQNFLSQQELDSLMSEAAFASGGRVGFKKGGMDRRSFIKLMGGLASLPILSKFIKPASKIAQKVTEVPQYLKEEGMPDFFYKVVEAVKQFGKKEKYKTGILKEDDVYTYRNSKTKEFVTVEEGPEEVRIEFSSDTGNPSVMGVRKGIPDEVTKGKTPPDEYFEHSQIRYPNPYGGYKDIVDEVAGGYDDLPKILEDVIDID